MRRLRKVTICIVAGGAVLVAVLLVMILRSGIRHMLYPPAPPMPAAHAQSIDAVLNEFENTLRAKAPRTLATFQPGLSEAQLEDFEALAGVQLSSDFKRLYQKWNGVVPGTTSPLVADHWFLPLEETTASIEAFGNGSAGTGIVVGFVSDVLAGHRKTWIQIMDDGAGDGYFFDTGRSAAEGQVFYCFAEIGSYTYFPSLGNLLLYFTECYTSGIYGDDVVTTVESINKAQEIAQKYGVTYPKE